MTDSSREKETAITAFGDVTDDSIEGIESDLRQILLDFGELALDQSFDPGLLKDIPVINTAAGIVKLIGRIRDGFFALKLKRVFQSSNKDQRKRFSERLKCDKQYAKRAVEKFLMLIDKTTDMQKCELFGKVIVAYAEERINENTMMRLFDAIDRLCVPDLPVLQDFYNLKGKTKGFIEANYNSLQNLGMCGLVTLQFMKADGWVGMPDEFSVNILGTHLITIVQDGRPPTRPINTTEGKS